MQPLEVCSLQKSSFEFCAESPATFYLFHVTDETGTFFICPAKSDFIISLQIFLYAVCIFFCTLNNFYSMKNMMSVVIGVYKLGQECLIIDIVWKILFKYSKTFPFKAA